MSILKNYSLLGHYEATTVSWSVICDDKMKYYCTISFSLKWELTAKTAPMNRQITWYSNDRKSKDNTSNAFYKFKLRKIILFLNNHKVIERNNIKLVASSQCKNQGFYSVATYLYPDPMNFLTGSQRKKCCWQIKKRKSLQKQC